MLPDLVESGNSGRDRSSGADLDPIHVSGGEISVDVSAYTGTSVLLQPQLVIAVAEEEYSCAGRSSGMKKVIHIVEENVFAAFGDEGEHDSYRWVLDSSASNHMSGCRAVFSRVDGGTVGTVRFANGSMVNITGISTVLYECKTGEHRALYNLYFIPRLTANIISIGQLDEDGYDIRIKDGVMTLRDENQKLLARISRSPRRLYMLDLHIAHPVCLAACAGEDAWRWHSRFGHVNFTTLKKMAKVELVRGLPTLEQVEQLCKACLAGKHKRASFPQQASRRASKTLELLHGDLCALSAHPHLDVTSISYYLWMTTIDTCGSL
jgi:hypothetical protein